ncbi:MAG TPA: helix-hairpin-helix domain-containing protein [Terracidiphilus sp.]
MRVRTLRTVILSLTVFGLWGTCTSLSCLPQTKDRAVVPAAPADRVDVNHASLAELMKVPGMTESWAGRIVRFRPYRTKVDLLERGVVTSEVYNRIKDHVIAHREKQ